MAKKAAAVPADREPMLALLRDVAESEHRLRHPAAFQSLCDALGFEVLREPHRTTVSDPSQPPAQTDE